VPAALGDSNERLLLSVPKINSGEGSFGKPNYPPDEIDMVSCEIRRGDDVLTEERPAFIKIDVEGFELRVLRGLERTVLKYKPPIIMEMVASHLANADTKVEDIVAFMTGIGYEPFQVGLQRRGLRHQLKVSTTKVTAEVDGDILWAHPANRIRLD
jgi:hypothetical protein